MLAESTANTFTEEHETGGMATWTVKLAPAGEEALRYVESLLKRSELPTEDVRDDHARFYVARADTGRIGVGGLEIQGKDALLRSVAVEPDRRGEGYGTAIVDALEAEAREAGVDRLTLLTTTASDFFEAHGYTEIDRAEAPDPIRATAEFADLCPTSATVMQKSL